MGDTFCVQNAEEVIAGNLTENLTVLLWIASRISIHINILHRYINVAKVVGFRRLVLGTFAIVVDSPCKLATLSILPHAEHVIETNLWVYAALDAALKVVALGVADTRRAAEGFDLSCPIRPIEGVDVVLDGSFSQFTIRWGVLRFAILREVGAESWTLSVPVIAETVAVAWVKVAEALSTFVVIVFLSAKAATVNLFFL